MLKTDIIKNHLYPNQYKVCVEFKMTVWIKTASESREAKPNSSHEGCHLDQ
jgi:hypothetical protein